MFKRAAICLTIFATFAFFYSFYSCSKSAEKFLNLNPNVQYVGIDKCRACHEDIYNSFIETGMGKSFGVATKEKSSAIFNTISPVFDPKLNMYYYPFWENNLLKIMEFRLNGNDTIHKRIETISHIIGSGHHTNSHFWMDGNFLFQAPLTFYTQDKKWGLPPGYEETNTQFNRKIDIECMSCHNAMPAVQKGSVNWFTKLPMGIDCERCHGPGEIHVKEKTAGNIIDTKTQTDYSIVNPKRLPWNLQVDICKRCHLQGNNILKEGKKFTDFKPGMHLSEVFNVYMPRYESNENFVMAGHTERFSASQCFIVSNSKNSLEAYNGNINFTCISCHNPHVSVRKTNIEKFNNVCKSCHFNNTTKSKLKKCNTSEIELKNPENNCVKCHMPSNGTSDIPHVTVHDHLITKPKKLRTINSKKAIGIYSVTSQKTSNEDLFAAYISWFEKFDSDTLFLNKAIKLQTENKNIETNIQFYYLQQNWAIIADLEKTININTIKSWTAYRIAKALDKLNNNNAKKYYQKSVELEKYNVDFISEYGNYLLRSKELNLAENILSNALQLQNKNERILSNLGAVYILQNKLNEGKNLLKKSIALNPLNPLPYLYLSELYAKTGNKEKGKTYFNKYNELINKP